MTRETSGRIARQIRIQGRVQGLGVRPAVARLADAVGIAGCVGNDAEGVAIVAEGDAETLQRFERMLPAALPDGALVECLASCEAPASGRNRFFIAGSANGEPPDGPIHARIPCDLAVCEECLRELLDPSSRRRLYPFTSCTRCGPRYSILTKMPYERQDTAMGAFAMCERCRTEYESPHDRRFHAQTNGCPQCGPQAWEEIVAGISSPFTTPRSDDPHAAVSRTVDALRAGRLAAVRGVGGYQLLCDATNDAAVETLRIRKRRPTKPLAVLVRSLDDAERLCEISPAERAALRSPANPIVLLRARAGNGLAARVSLELDTVGLMLPTSPLHALLAEGAGRPLVATSGNVSGETLPARVDEAQTRLREVADVWLHHDREILQRVDDSVVRVIAGQPATIRLGRGLAPLPLALENLLRPAANCMAPVTNGIVALGGHQKAAIAFSNGRQAVLGPHLGDMETPAARRRLDEHLREMSRLLGMSPGLFVHDRHPGYFTTHFAQQRKLPTMAVAHHHAHIVSGMVEQGWLEREALGVAFDGAGYGSDGTVWGGEFLRCTAARFRRVGHLRPFRLPGGERAIREPWRVALALAVESPSEGGVAETLRASGIGAQEIAAVPSLLRNAETSPAASRFAPITTSAGRLFDAAAALILQCRTADDEGWPAMRLEAACDRSETGRYPFSVAAGESVVLDWRPMLPCLIQDRLRGESPGRMAMRFHRGLADSIAASCRFFPDLPIVLSGGVFQNRILTELVCERLVADGRAVATPGRIPANDGGLAAGQLAVALARIAQGESF